MAMDKVISPSLLDSIDWDRYFDPDLFDLGPDAREFMKDNQREALLGDRGCYELALFGFARIVFSFK